MSATSAIRSRAAIASAPAGGAPATSAVPGGVVERRVERSQVGALGRRAGGTTTAPRPTRSSASATRADEPRRPPAIRGDRRSGPRRTSAPPPRAQSRASGTRRPTSAATSSAVQPGCASIRPRSWLARTSARIRSETASSHWPGAASSRRCVRYWAALIPGSTVKASAGGAADRPDPPPDEEHRDHEQEHQAQDPQPPPGRGLGRALGGPLDPLDQPGDHALDEAGLRGPVGGVGQLQLGQALGLVAVSSIGTSTGARARGPGPRRPTSRGSRQHRQGRWVR